MTDRLRNKVATRMGLIMPSLMNTPPVFRLRRAMR